MMLHLKEKIVFKASEIRLQYHLAAGPREIFKNFEANKKRGLLDLVFENLQLKGGILLFSAKELLLTMMDFKNHPKEWGRLDSNQRIPKERDLQSLAIATMRNPQKKNAGSRS